MGKELYEAYPTYTQALDETCELIDAELGAEPLKEVLLGTYPKAAELLTDTTYAQPALFALRWPCIASWSQRA